MKLLMIITLVIFFSLSLFAIVEDESNSYGELPEAELSIIDYIKRAVENNNKIQLDLFVMSQCPFGVEAEKVIIPIVKQNPDIIDLNIYYIADETKRGEFESMHGQAEVEENIRQLVINKLYPELFYDYLLQRAENYNSNWKETAGNLGIDINHVELVSAKEETKNLFRNNIKLSNILSVYVSPTLRINGENFEGSIFPEGYFEPSEPEPALSIEDYVLQAVDNNEPIKLDLFVMSQCPYGVEAEKTIIPFAKQYPDIIDLNLHYIASENENGEFESLHGPAEVEENIRQLIINDLYPVLFYDYLLLRAENYYTEEWEDIALGLEMDTEKIEQVINHEVTLELFRKNIQKSFEYEVNASPTLILNDEIFKGALFPNPRTPCCVCDDNRSSSTVSDRGACLKFCKRKIRDFLSNGKICSDAPGKDPLYCVSNAYDCCYGAEGDRVSSNEECCKGVPGNKCKIHKTCCDCMGSAKPQCISNSLICCPESNINGICYGCPPEEECCEGDCCKWPKQCCDGVCKKPPVCKKCENGEEVDEDDGTKCDDKDTCTVKDRCEGGRCIGDQINCPDCESCNKTTGVCEPDDSLPCDDGDDCTENDHCKNGECTGYPISSPDFCQICLDGEWVPDPSFNGYPCDDYDPCTKNDRCLDGICIGDPVTSGVNADCGGGKKK